MPPVFSGYSPSFKRAWNLSMLTMLIALGHTIYFQVSYSKAVGVLAQCQPWLARQSSTAFKTSCAAALQPDSTQSPHHYEEVKCIGDLWELDGGTAGKHFSVLNPALVDGVVIALPANVLGFFSLLVYFFVETPIKKLPELSAIAAILMIVSIGCLSKAFAIASSPSIPGDKDVDSNFPQGNRKFVKLGFATVSFLLFQCLATVVKTVFIIIVWSGKGYVEEDDNADPAGLVTRHQQLLEGEEAILLEDMGENAPEDQEEAPDTEDSDSDETVAFELW